MKIRGVVCGVFDVLNELADRVNELKHPWVLAIELKDINPPTWLWQSSLVDFVKAIEVYGILSEQASSCKYK